MTRLVEEFENNIGQHLEPHRTEWMIWDNELKFAGSIDMTFINDDGTIEIYDWKRSVGIKKENSWQSSITPCISHLPDCNFYHYSLQLNTYKALLEKNYNVKIKGMYLVCLHPNKSRYERIKVPNLPQEVAELFEKLKKIYEDLKIKNFEIIVLKNDKHSIDTNFLFKNFVYK